MDDTGWIVLQQNIMRLGEELKAAESQVLRWKDVRDEKRKKLEALEELKRTVEQHREMKRRGEEPGEEQDDATNERREVRIK